MEVIDPRISAAFREQNRFDLEPHLVVLGLVGSHSHGTYIEPTDPSAIDDVDLMGFVVPPLEYHLGLPQWEGWNFRFEELDVVLYSLEKAFRLLLKGNPNIVGLLWLREQEYACSSPAFEQLRAQRDIFSSRLAAESFCGYASGQLKRMEAFNIARMDEYERLTAAIREKVEIERVLQADSGTLKRMSSQHGISLDFLTQFRKLHREHFSGYQGAKRKALIRTYSFDVKHASHTIRLLRMGTEFLRTGQLQVYRHDAEELRAIKSGAWQLAAVKDEAEKLFAGIKQARDESPLPEAPDEAAAGALLVKLHRGVLGI